MAQNLERKKQAMSDTLKLIAEVDAALLDQQISLLPDEWQNILKHVPRKAQRQKVTMYFDKAMVREFKKLGVNWQSHVRALLAGYLKMVSAGILPSHRLDF